MGFHAALHRKKASAAKDNATQTLQNRDWKICFRPATAACSPEEVIQFQLYIVSLKDLPCDGHVRQARTAAAARPRADPQFMFSRTPQKRLVATHLFQHQDQELKHHNGKVTTVKKEDHRRVNGNDEYGKEI